MIAQKDSSIKIGCYWRSGGPLFILLGSLTFFRGAIRGALGHPPKKIKIKIDQKLSRTIN